MTDKISNNIYHTSIKEYQQKISDLCSTHILKVLADLTSTYDYYIEGTTQILDNNCQSISLELLPDGRIIYQTNNEFKILNLQTGVCDVTLKYHDWRDTIIITQKGNIISGPHEGNLTEFDTKTQNCRKICEKHYFEGFMQFGLELFDGRVLAGFGNKIKIINTQNNNVDLDLDHAEVHNCLILSDSQIVSVSKTTLKIWNVNTGICEFDLGYGVGSVEILSDGRIICGLFDGKIIILSHKKSCSFEIDITFADYSLVEGNRPRITYILEHSDGRIITATVEETVIKVWNIKNIEEPMILEGHSGYITCIEELPDGRIISGSYDQTLKNMEHKKSWKSTKMLNDIK